MTPRTLIKCLTYVYLRLCVDWENYELQPLVEKVYHLKKKVEVCHFRVWTRWMTPNCNCHFEQYLVPYQACVMLLTIFLKMPPHKCLTGS